MWPPELSSRQQRWSQVQVVMTKLQKVEDLSTAKMTARRVGALKEYVGFLGLRSHSRWRWRSWVSGHASRLFPE